MEYLTLQDIPHRQYNSLNSHRMASSHSSERPLGSMVAAVSEHPNHSSSSSLPVSLGESHSYSHSSLRLPLPPTSINPGQEDRTGRSAWRQPAQFLPAPRPSAQATPQSSDCYLNRSSTSSVKNELSNIFLTHSQNAHMRSSPPIQPNEHGYADKLPSFSEVCHCYAIGILAILIRKVSRHNTRTHTTTNSIAPAGFQ
jgi:hypothetical protein